MGNYKVCNYQLGTKRITQRMDHGYISFIWQGHKTSYIHPFARIYMPWNLKMNPYSVIASGANVLNTAPFEMA